MFVPFFSPLLFGFNLSGDHVPILKMSALVYQKSLTYLCGPGIIQTYFVIHYLVKKIWYLPHIKASPTSYNCTAYLEDGSSSSYRECEQHNIICTYDLNIAKIALEIQNQLQPKFDNAFIILGPFHIQLAYFKALGKVIDGSGIWEILYESDLIAQGSLNGFMGATHCNRCRRLYPILGVALKKLALRTIFDSNSGNWCR